MIAIAIYAIILLAIGFAASKKMHDIKDYFAGGKNMGFLAVAFSARATGESAWLLIGLTGMGFALGVNAFWVVVGEIIGVGGAWLFMAKRFKRLTDRYDSITVPDYLESRFRDKTHMLRLVAAGSLLVFVPIYAGAQVYASGGAFDAFLQWPDSLLGWSHYIGATFGFLIVLVYITQGGFTAVVWSDVFQGSLMVIGLVALPIIGLMEAGGVTNIIDSLKAIDPHLLTLHGPGSEGASSGGWNTGTIFAVVGLAAIGIGFWGSPQIFVRYISMKSEKSILPGTITAIIWTLLADSGAVLIGIIGRALFNQEIGLVKEDTVSIMANNLLPAFFAGVFIAMVLAAIMSTIDSLLVLASSAVVRDFWQKTKNPDLSDSQLMSMSKKLTIVLAFVAFAVGIGLLLIDKDKPIFWIVIFGWSGIAATFCPTMILSLYWSKLTASGAKYAMIAGFLGVPIFSFAVGPLLRSLDPKPVDPEVVATALMNGEVIEEASRFFGTIAEYLSSLDVLLPSFLIGFTVAIVVSLLDKKGQANLVGIEDDMNFAKTGKE